MPISFAIFLLRTIPFGSRTKVKESEIPGWHRPSCPIRRRQAARPIIS
jgi:hypothetical protein